MNSPPPPPHDDDVPALPTDMAALLAVERRVSAPPDAARAAVLAGVNQAIVHGAVVASSAGAAGRAATATAAAGPAGSLLKGLAALTVAAGVAGGGAWIATRGHGEPRARAGVPLAAANHRAAPPSARAGVHAPPLRPLDTAAAQTPASRAQAEGAPATQRTPDAPSHSGGADATHASSAQARAPAIDETDPELLRQNDLLAAARGALSRRDAAGAIAALERHAARFPRGRLAQEREALWVQALVLEGDLAAARARAEQFRLAYPRSLYQGVVDAALGHAP